MPEGPEIRRAADKIAAVLEDCLVDEVVFGLPQLKRWEVELTGQRVLRLETRGKALLTHFENGLSVYSHNQLYGRWYVVKRDRYPDTNRSLRMALHTTQHSALLYSASDISVWETARLLEHPFLAKVGPDILDPGLHWRDVAARLLSDRFCRRKLGGFYLDQDFVAGIGNYLRSEILFLAGVYPWARPVDLSRKQLNELARQTLEVARRSYETGGVTTTPRLHRSLKAAGLPRREYRHMVFGRSGRACYSCGTDIIKDVVGSRRLYWCPVCQYELSK
jgi:endonuclease-8